MFCINKRKTGSRYEDQAAAFLEKQGLLVIEKNFRCKSGEIDLIARDGKYLVFVSARTFSPTYGRTEWNHVYNDMNKVYILPLAKDAPVLFAPKNDVVRVETSVKE